MSNTTHELGIYLALVRAAERRHQPLVRDRMLVLAGVTAAQQQLDVLAAYCRAEILKHNPHHITARWPSLKQALADEDFLALLRQLRRRFPFEKAERMVETLGIFLTPFDAETMQPMEYAAAILDVDVVRFGSSD